MDGPDAWRRRKNLEGGKVVPKIISNEDTRLDDEEIETFEVASSKLNPEEAIIAREEAQERGEIVDENTDDRSEVKTKSNTPKSKNGKAIPRVVGSAGLSGTLLTANGEKILLKDIEYPEDFEGRSTSGDTDPTPSSFDVLEASMDIDRDKEGFPPTSTFHSNKETRNIAAAVRSHNRPKTFILGKKSKKSDHKGGDSIRHVGA